MSECFYKATQFLMRDADGVTTPYIGDIEIRLDSDNTLIDTIPTVNGWIEDGMVVGYTPGDKLRFKSPDYPSYLVQTSGVDLEEAYQLNTLASFTIENLFTETREPEYVTLYLEDLDNPDVPITKIGTMPTDSTMKFPYESMTTKNFKVYAVPEGASVSQGANEFENISNDSLIVPPNALITAKPRYRRYFMLRR